MVASSEKIRLFVKDLQEAREYRRIPLEQVSRDTRISLHYLKALEEGHWDQIPGPYLRGYLTNYAETVGMVRDKVLKRFEELGYQGAGDNPEETRSEPPPFTRSPDREAEPEDREILVPTLWQVMPGWLKSTLLALLIGIPVLLVVLLFGLSGKGGEQVAEPFEDTLEQSRDESESQRAVLQGFAPFEVKIGLMRPAALQVFSRDSVFFRGSMPSDTSLVLESSSEVVIETERLQELNLWRDGKKLELPADSGRAELHVSRQGVQVILRNF